MKEDKTHDFINRARTVHGYKYDYSKTKYIHSKQKVAIICFKHGEFEQRVDNHLSGKGCPKCKIVNLKFLVFGIGINDCEETVTKNRKHIPSYKTWVDMLKRCYDKKNYLKQLTYINCVVCDEWLYFSKFKAWYDKHYVEGYALDKDILIKGNKTYSPTTCCFVPQEINGTFIKCNKRRGDLPIGVIYNKNKTKYVSTSRSNHKNNSLGVYETVEEAFRAYKVFKENHIKEIANKYKDKIESNIYLALMKYEVEVTD